MSREDIRKLVGGYATGTLTAEEQQALFAAALEDQELFDELMREQPLREVVGDPAARAELLAAVDDALVPWYRRLWNPASATAMTMALMVAAVVIWQYAQRPKPLPLAKLTLPARPVEAPPVLPPLPETAPRPALKDSAVRLPPGIPPAAAPPPPPAAPTTLAEVVPTLPPAPLELKKDSPAALSGAQLFDALRGARGFQPGNGFVAGFGLPNAVRGTVVDPNGAVVPSATVEVKAEETGQVVTTSTDAQGQFQALGLPAGAYTVTATAPGFKKQTVSVAAARPAPPVRIQLDVGSVSEAVMVTASTALLQTASSENAALVELPSLEMGRMDARHVAPAAVIPPLRYRVGSRQADGSTGDIPADGKVAAGASVFLEVTATAGGNLRIVQQDRTVNEQVLETNKTVEIPLPRVQGRQEFQLVFAEGTPNTRAMAGGRGGPRATPSGAPFRATITLDFQ